MDKVTLWYKTGLWCKGFMIGFFLLPFLIVDENQSRFGFLNIFYLVALAIFLLALIHVPVRDKVLNTTGIYKYTRHPFYWALLLVNLATWLQVETWTSPLFLLMEALFLACFAASIYCQEKETRERFGEDALKYHESTPRFCSYRMVKNDLQQQTDRLKAHARNLNERKPNVPSYSTVKVGVKQELKGRYERFVSKAKATIAALKE